MKSIVVIDYGSGNKKSVLNALRKVVDADTRVLLSSDADEILASDRAILPGVGAYGACMAKLESRGLAEIVIEFSKRKVRPLLGICCGMQILSDYGEEFGERKGLGLISGKVRSIRCESDNLRLPHIGWTPLIWNSSSFFDSEFAHSRYYFVHSFVFDTPLEHSIIAKAHYGETFIAALQYENLVGFQFHPEKSDAAGLKLLYTFCKWSP